MTGIRYQQQYLTWHCRLFLGFNLLVHGYGSKKVCFEPIKFDIKFSIKFDTMAILSCYNVVSQNLLMDFAEKTLQEHYMAVNGYFPTITVKQV